jgi:hypothetical protein
MLFRTVLLLFFLVSKEQFGAFGFAPSIGNQRGARQMLQHSQPPSSISYTQASVASVPVLSLSLSSVEEITNTPSNASSRSRARSTLRKIFNSPKKLLIAAALMILSTMTAMPSVANAWISHRNNKNNNATIEIHPEGHHQESFPGPNQQSTTTKTSAEHSQKIHVITASGVVLATGLSGYAKVAARNKEQQALLEKQVQEEEETSTFPMVIEFPPELTTSITDTDMDLSVSSSSIVTTYVPKIPSPATVQRNRQQPRPEHEAKALSEYYASIPNLSDRAFQILLDLGMVEIHNNNNNNNNTP